MKVQVFIVCAIFVVGAFAQNAPPINWALVRPMHENPSFFDDYPFLQQLFMQYSPAPPAPGLDEGRAGTRNQYPYQAALVLSRTGLLGFCSGSIITNEWILTAGHCVERVDSGTAILGGFDILNANEIGQLRFAVTEFHSHPGWNGIRLADDVGLIRLPVPIQFSATIQAIRLSNFRQISSSYIDQLSFMSGWGRALFSTATPPQPAVIRFAHFQLSSQLGCRLTYPNVIESGQICGITSEPSGPLCPGDAGGPLTIFEADGNPTQIGVQSFVGGLGCGFNYRPVIFTRLNFYLRWVSQMTGLVISEDFAF